MHNIYFTTEAAYEAVKEELWNNGTKYPRPLIVDIIETNTVLFDDSGEHYGTVNATATNGTIVATVNGEIVSLPYNGLTGTAVSLEVVPDDGFQFVSWDDMNTDNPRIVIVEELDKSLSVECTPAMNKWLTFEGLVDIEGINALGVQWENNFNLEYSIEDTPTTWKSPAPFADRYMAPSMEELMAGGYNKLHIRATAAGNTSVYGFVLMCKKISGPILSLLDNTCSLTSVPDAGFCDLDNEEGLFIAGEAAENPPVFLEDVSGLIFPDIPVGMGAYGAMFSEQTLLTKAPAVLPSKSVSEFSYAKMFLNTALCQQGGEMSILAENFESLGDGMFVGITGSNRFNVNVHTNADQPDAVSIAQCLGIMQGSNVWAVDENGNEGQAFMG